MIGISKLYCGAAEASDALRYGRRDGPGAAGARKPIVVFNCTRRCNLRCVHCYSNSTDGPNPGEMSTNQALAMIDDLADFGAPVLLLSGGEPLMREDLFTLAATAVERGIRAVVSTNGTLITPAMAERLREASVGYVGVSLDGLGEVNDRFRGRAGAFADALAGIRNCRQAGMKVGLRFTVTGANVSQVADIFSLLRDEDIPRACFYHLVYAGRGVDLAGDDLSHEQTRELVDLIIDKTAQLHADGLAKEILTVDNHADGPYLYMRMLREGGERAGEVLRLLRTAGANSSGDRIGCVSWDGEVHPDQFWRGLSLGNVTDRPFSEIWTDLSNPLMAKLKHKAPHVTGRCSTCRFLAICGGGLRTRAEAVTGDLWASDPACYLTDEEIAGPPLPEDDQ